MWIQKVVSDIWAKLSFLLIWNLQVKHTIKDLALWSQSNIIFMYERNETPKTKNKRNLNTKLHFLQNDQNADTALLHSHEVMK